MSILCVPSYIPNVVDDCGQLHKAFSGWGTNEDLIISILGHRSAAQRKAIRHFYAETYGEDLLKQLDMELNSDFERVVLLWVLEPAERDALLANEATKKWTASNEVLHIGCGHGLPGIFSCIKGATPVHFQDFNEEVLRCLTLPNVNANLQEKYKVETRFFSGDWGEIHNVLSSVINDEQDKAAGYDVIIMAEKEPE